ncbi:c-type cytochrome [Terriglobus sp. ADX1]|uniref:c-type cytochrome n=1 Tax=Terriglobus sp. ADX1 TaxID=2794063 RepID=UPI002FE6AAC9
MAKQSRNSGRSSRRGGNGGTGKLILGMLLGAILTLATIAAWMRFGKPPVAVSDAASLWEPLVASVPANARAKSEAKTPPFPASEDTFEAAARLYRQQCVSCHGAPGQSSATGRAMSPRAPQFFSPQDKSVLAGQKPGEIYWKTAYGIRRTGMPAFGKTFTDTQLWQISLLLQASNGELPDPVRNLLTEGLPPLQPTEIKP